MLIFRNHTVKSETARGLYTKHEKFHITNKWWHRFYPLQNITPVRKLDGWTKPALLDGDDIVAWVRANVSQRAIVSIRHMTGFDMYGFINKRNDVVVAFSSLMDATLFKMTFQ